MGLWPHTPTSSSVPRPQQMREGAWISFGQMQHSLMVCLLRVHDGCMLKAAGISGGCDGRVTAKPVRRAPAFMV